MDYYTFEPLNEWEPVGNVEPLEVPVMEVSFNTTMTRKQMAGVYEGRAEGFQLTCPEMDHPVSLVNVRITKVIPWYKSLWTVLRGKRLVELSGEVKWSTGEPLPSTCC